MVAADWGLDTEETSFAHVPHDRCEPIDSDDPAMLPQAQAARAQGYEPAHEAPMWCFLPAIWPESARAWVRDTRVRHASGSCDGRAWRAPWSAADHAEIEVDTNEMLRRCGLPPRPAGRVWLLKPPPGFTNLQETLGHLGRTAELAGLDAMASRSFVEHVERELDTLFRPTT